MHIVCPSCATSYQVSEASIGAGRQVRCVRCREVWLAAPQPALALAQAEEAAPQAVVAEEPPAALPEPETATAEPEPLPEPSVAAAATVEAPALVPTDHQAPPSLDEAHAGATLAAPPDRPRTLRPTWPTVILSLLVVIGTVLVWRAETVRALPQTASLFAAIGLPVNLRGLVFTDVRTVTEMQDGVPVLVVEGAIANVTRARAEVPRLRLAMRDAAGLEVYAWTALPPSPTLAPGEAQAFRTRLALPPAEGREVLVRFLHRRDR